ncbi:MAG: saccharopine dehydrogenase NADP-binding domain-containing protein [Bdellovibrionales bacterium]|nr:saccharopine dehydrogenase NADP-binding domain-containing protein [Massilia sp.]
MTKDFDIIVFGATGFTGRLVAQYLTTAYPHGEIEWAMAGRDAGKLEQVRALIGAPATVALITAHACDGAALAALVARTRVVITTVGPYQLHGEALAIACAKAGTDYLDLCGEPVWMAKMIPLLEGPASTSGARILFSCGFDSIPFDLGVLFLQEEAQKRFGAPLRRVHGRVRTMKGALSGGTLASALATIEAVKRDPQLGRLMADPFALTPGFAGPPQPEGERAQYDALAKSWTGPFMMAAINTKNIHRTNALLSHRWGREFEYDERMLTGDGSKGERKARKLATTDRLQNALLGFAPTRFLLRKFALPKPGEGPGKAERENGRYELHFMGRAANGTPLRVSVTGDRDPGYGSTAKMISESALCLVADPQRTLAAGGVWTAGSALGMLLLRRLEERAGLRFSVIEE